MLSQVRGALLATLLTTGAQAAEPLRIGIITDMSGQYADANGPGAVIAAQMAAEDVGGAALGRTIEVISGDHQNKPDVGAAIVREWIDNRGVNVVAESVNSSVALAVQAVTRNAKKIFLISGSGSTELTGKQCSPTSVHWTYDTYASSHATAKALLAQGGDKWFFLTADYAFGLSLAKDATATLNANGGKVVGEVRHPFHTMDFSSFLLQAQANKEANVIALANAGSDFANAARQYVEFGLDKSGKKLVGLQITITDVPGIGLDILKDIQFTDSFYWDRTDETRAFAARFMARKGEPPSSYQAGVYSAVRHYLRAVQAVGSEESAAVMAQMRATPVDDFFAHGGVIRDDGRMVHDMYLMRFKRPEESKSMWDLYAPVATIPGAQAFRPMKDGGCPFVGQ